MTMVGAAVAVAATDSRALASWSASAATDAATTALLAELDVHTSASSSLFFCDAAAGRLYIWPQRIDSVERNTTAPGCLLAPGQPNARYCCTFTQRANAAAAFVVVPVDNGCLPTGDPAWLLPTLNAPTDLVLWRRSAVFIAATSTLYVYGGTTVVNTPTAPAPLSPLSCGSVDDSYWTTGQQCLAASNDTLIISLAGRPPRPQWRRLPANVTGQPPSNAPPYNAYDAGTSGMTHVLDAEGGVIVATGAFTQRATSSFPPNVMGQTAVWVFNVSAEQWRFQSTSGDAPYLDEYGAVSTAAYTVQSTEEAAAGGFANRQLIAYGGLTLDRFVASGWCFSLDLVTWMWTVLPSCSFGAGGIFLRGDAMTIHSRLTSTTFLVGGMYTTLNVVPFFTHVPSDIYAMDMHALTWAEAEVVVAGDVASAAVFTGSRVVPGTLVGGTLLSGSIREVSGATIPPAIAAALALPATTTGTLVTAVAVGGGMVNVSAAPFASQGYYDQLITMGCSRFVSGGTSRPVALIGNASLFHRFALFIAEPFVIDQPVIAHVSVAFAATIIVGLTAAYATGAVALALAGAGVAAAWLATRHRYTAVLEPEPGIAVPSTVQLELTDMSAELELPGGGPPSPVPAAPRTLARGLRATAAAAAPLPTAVSATSSVASSLRRATFFSSGEGGFGDDAAAIGTAAEVLPGEAGDRTSVSSASPRGSEPDDTLSASDARAAPAGHRDAVAPPRAQSSSSRLRGTPAAPTVHLGSPVLQLPLSSSGRLSHAASAPELPRDDDDATPAAHTGAGHPAVPVTQQQQQQQPHCARCLRRCDAAAAVVAMSALSTIGLLPLAVAAVATAVSTWQASAEQSPVSAAGAPWRGDLGLVIAMGAAPLWLRAGWLLSRSLLALCASPRGAICPDGGRSVARAFLDVAAGPIVADAAALALSLPYRAGDAGSAVPLIDGTLAWLGAIGHATFLVTSLQWSVLARGTLVAGPLRLPLLLLIATALIAELACVTAATAGLAIQAARKQQLVEVMRMQQRRQRLRSSHARPLMSDESTIDSGGPGEVEWEAE